MNLDIALTLIQIKGSRKTPTIVPPRVRRQFAYPTSKNSPKTLEITRKKNNAKIDISDQQISNNDNQGTVYR